MKQTTHIPPPTALEKGNGATGAVNLARAQEPIVWPDELLAIAEKQHLRLCLEPMLHATREIFPTARWIKVYAQTDYQDPPEQNIIFDVQVPDSPFPHYRDAQKAWNEKMFRLLPEQFIHHFLLFLRLVGQ
jgi:hypothetical protein